MDPAGLRGLWLMARAGPVRDAVTGALGAVPLPQRRVHPGVTDETIYGGLDLTATLSAGRPVRSPGLLETPALLVLTMAERCPAGLAARLGRALDAPGPALVALDEAAGPDEGLPGALSDRLAFFVALDGVLPSDAAPLDLDPAMLARARARLAAVRLPDGAAAAMTRAAAALGIASLRAPLLALAAARAHAALAGRDRAEDEDLRAGADLCLAHRATALPDAPETPPPPDQPPPEQTPPEQTPDPQAQSVPQDLPDEMLVEAARANLPADLLARLAAARALRGARGATGSGDVQSGNRRGRPLPSRPGRLAPGVRLDLVATIRAAAPWQPLRRQAADRPGMVLLLRGSDLRLRRFREQSDRVLIFAVDASGSAAFARLAEAKGAIELLLGQAYARRDHVALLAFRGAAADLILPPTRSLVQTKRRLGALPGGGGTPLAAGLRLAMATAAQARARGLTPTIALLTDGRGNVALDGSANRPLAAQETEAAARAIRAAATPTLVIDTATRPQPALQTLSHQMAATYLPLPRADAQRLSAVLDAALAG